MTKIQHLKLCQVAKIIWGREEEEREGGGRRREVDRGRKGVGRKETEGEEERDMKK